MRVILDTNVFVSYLLVRHRRRKVADVVEACLTDTGIELLAPQELIEEITRVVVEKEHLRKRISQESLEQILTVLRETATLLPFRLENAPISRDPGDDFLLAHGLAEAVDLVVTGDDDLLSLVKVGPLRIISVAKFWDLLFDNE